MPLSRNSKLQADDEKPEDVEQEEGEDKEDDELESEKPGDELESGDTETEEGDKDEDESMSARSEVKRYLAAFGPQGAEWYADGITFEQATATYSAQLKEENERLKKLLDQSRGEAESLSSGLEESPRSEKERNLQSKVGDNRAKYAAAIKLNTSKN